jgi:hypothetical protein
VWSCPEVRGLREEETMFRKSTINSKRRVRLLLVAGLLALGIVGLTGGVANAALTYGPTGKGSMSGYAYCSVPQHTIGLYYTANPELTYSDPGLNSTTWQLTPVAELIEVWAYIKSPTSTWTPIAHSVKYVDRNMAVMNQTIPGWAGTTYNVGYLVRVAFIGANWSDWQWDWATLQTTNSGATAYSSAIFSSPGYCQT